MTPAQIQIFAAILKCLVQGQRPTVRNIQKRLPQRRSISTIHAHIESLQRNGFLVDWCGMSVPASSVGDLQKSICEELGR